MYGSISRVHGGLCTGDREWQCSYYDAFGVFGAIFRELEWKTPIFSWRADPKTPNASYARARQDLGRPKVLWRVLRVVEKEQVLGLVGAHRVAVPWQDPVLVKVLVATPGNIRRRNLLRHVFFALLPHLVLAWVSAVQESVRVQRVALAEQRLQRPPDGRAVDDPADRRDAGGDVLGHQRLPLAQEVQPLFVDRVVDRLGQPERLARQDVPAVDQEGLDLGSGRIVASEIEVPIILVNLV